MVRLKLREYLPKAERCKGIGFENVHRFTMRQHHFYSEQSAQINLTGTEYNNSPWSACAEKSPDVSPLMVRDREKGE